MWSLTNVIFFVALILGIIVFYLLSEWNGKKLSSAQLKEIRNEINRLTSKVLVVTFILGGLLAVGKIILEKLGYESLEFAYFLCFMGVGFLFGVIRKHKTLIKLRVSPDYIITENYIGYFGSAFLLFLGLLNLVIFLEA